MREKTKRHLSGFTFVELIVAMAILSTLAAVTIASMSGNRTRQEVESATRLVASVVREAQNYALTGKNITATPTARPCQFRVVGAGASISIEQLNAGDDQCPLIPGTATSGAWVSGATYPLSNGVTVSAGGVRFDVPRGEPTNSSGVELSGVTGPVDFSVSKGDTAHVCVYPLGRIEEKPVGGSC